MPGEAPNHERAPQAPADVQARHRRVLIRHAVQALRIERPDSADVAEGVDEAVVRHTLLNGERSAPVGVLGWRGVEQPRRHQREQREPDQSEDGRCDQRCAIAGEGFTAAHEQPAQNHQREREVGRSVEHVEDLVPADAEPALDRRFMEQPDRLFEIDDPDRIVERVPGNIVDPHVGRAELVAHEAVHHIHDADQRDLAQPWQHGAQLPRRTLGWHRHERQL